jgi:hypothetical protein
MFQERAEKSREQEIRQGRIGFSRLAHWAAVVLAVCQFARLLTVNSERPEFHHFDEPNWIWVGCETWRHAMAGDWNGTFWREEYSGWGAPNPQLGKLFIGAPVDFFLRVNPDVKLHEFGNLDGPADTATWPDPRLYYPARVQAAIFTMLTALLLVDLGTALFGGGAALAAVLWFGTHPYVEVCSFRAMTDACMAFGTMLAFWGLFRRQGWARVLAVGVGLGWAAATRINGLFIAPVVALGLVMRARAEGRPGRAGIQALAVLVLAAALFFGTNPLLWQEPLAGLKLIFGHSAGPGPGLLTMGRLALWGETFKGLFWDTCPTGGLPESSLVTRALRGLALAYAVAVLVRSTHLDRRRFLACSALMALLLVFGVPKLWERYFLPGLPMLSLLAGYGAATFLRVVWPRIEETVRAGRRLESGDGGNAERR